METNDNICVYQHVRLDTNEVFYIGIGNEKRPYQKHGRNMEWNIITLRTKYRVDILFFDLTWEEACIKEKELIQLYGRKDLGVGILVNLTDGGDGVKGIIKTDIPKLNNNLEIKPFENHELTSHINNNGKYHNKVKELTNRYSNAKKRILELDIKTIL